MIKFYSGGCKYFGNLECSFLSLSLMESVRHGDPVIDCTSTILSCEWILTPILPYPDGETPIKPFMVSMGGFRILKELFLSDRSSSAIGTPRCADFCRNFYFYLSWTAVFFFLMEIYVLCFSVSF